MRLGAIVVLGKLNQFGQIGKLGGNTVVRFDPLLVGRNLLEDVLGGLVVVPEILGRRELLELCYLRLPFIQVKETPLVCRDVLRAPEGVLLFRSKVPYFLSPQETTNIQGGLVAVNAFCREFENTFTKLMIWGAARKGQIIS